MLAEDLEEFAACIRRETMPEKGDLEAMRALALIRRALESQKTGSIVKLE